MPSDVNGLTKADAPCAGVVPGESASASAARTFRYVAYEGAPKIATTRPTSDAAFAPAATTVPAPSLPIGNARPTRPATLVRRTSGMSAIVAPLARRNEPRSAGPNKFP
jgi:hypothetical protein